MTNPSEYPILEKLQSESLASLSEAELAPLCDELRRLLIQTVTKNGGHLASNLGMVEATVALHRVFSTPSDHILFDVGHQCYVHKILTDRLDRFSTLREPGGISGFPRRDESAHDAFIAGHSGNSLAAAVGFAEADLLEGRPSHTIAVVGDGAYTCGMIHEALNNCRAELPLIILLNENEMSISRNIGGFASYLAKIRATKRYYRAKRRTKNFLRRIPLLGKPLAAAIARVKTGFKNRLYGSNIFEAMGIYYFGPVDGHDLRQLEAVLEEAKTHGGCCVVHIKTKKGHGYSPAEANPGSFHGLPPEGSVKSESFSERFGTLLCERAKKDPRILAITAAMADGTGLRPFAERYPDRFFDVGIAEEYAVTFAAGLSAAGMKPVTAIYSTFLQRGYDQLLHDFALQKLPGIFAVDRAGLASRDGPTHHGIYDVSFCSQVAGAVLYAPLDFAGLAYCLDTALADTRLSFIRYPSGGEPAFAAKMPYINKEAFLRGVLPEGKAPDAVIIGYGSVTKEALAAKETLQKDGIAVAVLAAERLKPYEQIAKALSDLLGEARVPVLFVEEGVRTGGAGMLLREALPSGIASHYAVLAIDETSACGVLSADPLCDCKIGRDNCVDAVRKMLSDG